MPSLVTPYVKLPDWFTVPLEWAPELAGVPGPQLVAGRRVALHRSHLALLAKRYDSARDALQESVGDHTRFDEEVAGTGKKLRGYQHVARDFIQARRGTLLADTMRLGKTPTTVAAHDPASGPLVVVAPLCTRQCWLEWMRWRWPDVTPLVMRGRTADPSLVNTSPLVYCHYDVLPAWQPYALRFNIGTLVFDEAHVLSNRMAKRTQAALQLGTRAARVVALTGTPMWNRPAGLWPILAAVNPGAWGRYYDFAYRYCAPEIGTYGTSFKGASNEDEFRQRVAQIMLRRTWHDVRDELPATERSVEIAEVTADQAQRLEEMAESIREAGRRRVQAGEIARFRRLLGKIKAPVAADIAQRTLAAGEPVVVWAWHRDVAQDIGARLRELEQQAYVITGAIGQDARDAAMAAWKKSEQPAALVATMPVAQVGIDLSHARHCVYAEVDFTPLVVAQSEMRTFSPDRPMTVTYVMADHDVDRRIVGTLREKCALAASIGVPAAETAIDVIAQAFDVTADKGDLERLATAFLADYDEFDSENGN